MNVQELSMGRIEPMEGATNKVYEMDTADLEPGGDFCKSVAQMTAKLEKNLMIQPKPQ